MQQGLPWKSTASRPWEGHCLTQRDLSATIPKRAGLELVSSSIRQINVMPLAQGGGGGGEARAAREVQGARGQGTDLPFMLSTVTCGAL